MGDQRSLFDEDVADIGQRGVARARAILAGDLPAPGVAEERAEEAIATVGLHADGWVEDVALPFIRDYLERHAELFGDDLWTAGLPEPPNTRRALGAAIKKAAERGWIRDSGRVRRSRSSNSIKKTVWLSNLTDGQLL